MQKPLILLLSVVFIATGLLCLLDADGAFYVHGQTEGPGVIRVGERITYNISLGRFPNVGYAETYVVSRGKLGGKEVYEVQSKLKTINYVAVDDLLADAVRTAFVSPTDGTPIVVKNVDTSTGAPTETSVNFAEKAPGTFDLSTILFKVRASGGSGAFQMYENERQYVVTWNTVGSEIVKTDAGEFPTHIIEVQSRYLTEHGITNLKINISTEESAIPVQVRAKTAKGELRALVASIQVAPEPTPTAAPVSQTPLPTPKPSPSVAAYIENQPLIAKPFSLGETLEFTVKTGGRNVGTMVLSAKERKLIAGKDSLVLSAMVSNPVGGDVFRIGNGVRSNVDPDSLSPFDLEIRFDGPLSGFNQSAKFDGEAGRAIVAGGNPVDIPIGTHNILSLIYAMRQFNLNPSRDSTNPINDTRVAVFWMGKPNIFTLRPAMPQQVTIGEQKISAQQIAVTTGNPQLDALGLKFWLSTDPRRIPLRFVIGSYQLDLNLANLEFQP